MREIMLEGGEGKYRGGREKENKRGEREGRKRDKIYCKFLGGDSVAR